MHVDSLAAYCGSCLSQNRQGDSSLEIVNAESASKFGVNDNLLLTGGKLLFLLIKPLYCFYILMYVWTNY